tara:strand:+ start:8924 stop:9637 length:714 start_codon:yes stop_codon:yes gene_type:complete
MKTSITISAIVPFHNEERSLKESVQRLIDVGIFKEIILIDDNSNDKSNQIASDLALVNEFISVYKIKKSLGKGNAVRYGLKKTKTSHVIVHDADLEYFPKDIVEMFKFSKKYPNDLILGSRRIGNKERKNLYFYTYAVNALFSNIFSIINAYKVSDISSCYQLNSLENLIKMNLSEDGFAMEVEILSKTLRMNNKIYELPISYHARSYGDGKKITVIDALLIFLKMFKYSRFNIFFK